MPIRDDSAGSYGTWNNDDLSWLDYLKANASDGGNALANLGRNLVDGFSPIGTSEQGNMALQVPPIVSGIAQSYGRLAGTPSHPGNAYSLTGVPELDAPIQQDMSNVLLSLYGGNAVSGLTKPRGALGAGAMKDAAPLPMDHASRMARAREMGFDVDVPLYHGTQAQFDAFEPSKFGSFGPGVYVTKDQRHAGHFAQNKSGPRGEILDLRARGSLASWDDVPSEVIDRSFWVDFLGKDGSPATRAAAWAKDNGYTGFSSGDNSVIFDPSNIRSINAAFDPARAGENGLLLSDTGKPSILGSAMANNGDDQMSNEDGSNWWDYFTTLPTRQTGYQPQPEPPRNALLPPPRPMPEMKPNAISDHYEAARNKHLENAAWLAGIGGTSTAAAYALARTGSPYALIPALGLGAFGTFNTSIAAPGQSAAAWQDNDRRFMWENTHFDDPDWIGTYNPALGY